MQTIRIISTATQEGALPPQLLRDQWVPKIGPTAFVLGWMISELGHGVHELDEAAWTQAVGLRNAEVRFRLTMRRLTLFGLGLYWPDTKAWTFYTHWQPPTMLAGYKLHERQAPKQDVA